ncbi:PAS domain-containing sensor histidine kinase [Thalassoroseus pseudoceratinae]|uniref:PAS domain-containing sensor histidine kinase n=1 Tax=Thalassoroseus pseudoceratinae TaxID=2713176 RepID=UPI00142250E0|nr:PAS domain S-box protein [Thalassoroseus pseudoceratinae]
MEQESSVSLADYESLQKQLAELQAENEDLRREVLRYRASRDGDQRTGNHNAQSATEHQLSLVVDKAPIIFWSMDRHGIFTESRGRGLDLIGLGEGDAVGWSVWEMYREYPNILETIRNVLDGEELSETVYLDGTYFDTHYTPILSESRDEVVGVRGMSVVVTDREIARIAFQQTSEIFREAFVINALGLLVLTEDTLSVVDANTEFLGIVGCDRGEIVGQMLSQLPMFNDLDLFEKLRSEAFAYGRSNPVDTILKTKDGKEITVTVSADRLQVPHQDYVLMIVEETTKRRRVLRHFEEKQSELDGEFRQPYANWQRFAGELENLIKRRSPIEHADGQLTPVQDSKLSENALTYFLECVPDTVCTLDRSGTLLYVNRAQRPSRVEDLVGKSAYDFISPQKAEESRAVIQRVFETGEIMTQEVQSPGVDGVLRHFSCRIGPIRRFGRVIAVIVVATDMTKLFEAQDAVRRRQLEFERLAQLTSLGQMATMVAHEVNNPLAAIANFARGCIRRIQKMTSEPSETAAQTFQAQSAGLIDALEGVTEQANQASNSIRRLRRFLSSRGSASHRVATYQIIQEAVHWVTPIARVNGVEILLDVPDSLPNIAADPLQIEQVLVHLISNAVEAFAEHGRSPEETPPVVHLSAVVHQETLVKFTIADNGPGLSKEVLENLFEPFFTTKKTGFGMGLTMSRAIVEQYGGRLWRDEQNRPGVVFHFTLPISQGENPRV